MADAVIKIEDRASCICTNPAVMQPETITANASATAEMDMAATTDDDNIIVPNFSAIVNEFHYALEKELGTKISSQSLAKVMASTGLTVVKSFKSSDIKKLEKITTTLLECLPPPVKRAKKRKMNVKQEDESE